MNKLQELNQQIYKCCKEKNIEKEKVLNLVCEAFQNTEDTFKKNKVKIDSINIGERLYNLFTPRTWIKLKRKYNFDTIWVVVNDGLYASKLDKKGNLSKECILIKELEG